MSTWERPDMNSCFVWYHGSSKCLGISKISRTSHGILTPVTTEWWSLHISPSRQRDYQCDWYSHNTAYLDQYANFVTAAQIWLSDYQFKSKFQQSSVGLSILSSDWLWHLTRLNWSLINFLNGQNFSAQIQGKMVPGVLNLDILKPCKIKVWHFNN